MTTLVILVGIVAFSYWVESRRPGSGVITFFIAVAIWQIIEFGPGSLLARDECARYSHYAREDC